MTAVASSPVIEQLFDPVTGTKCLPGKGAKGRGEFVNWGTKLYQLELELSYKNNEIEVMKKKMKKFADELYPDGNTAKKSVVEGLKNQCEVSKRKLENTERKLKWEQKRCKGLEHDLSEVKKQNLALRRQNLSNDKAVQTIPENSKQVQISPSKKKQSRSVMTQCSPTVINVSSSTRVTSLEPGHALVENRSSSQKKPQKVITQVVKNTNVSNDVKSSTTTISSSFGSSYSSLSSVETTTRVTPRKSNQTNRLSKNVTVENKVEVAVAPAHPSAPGRNKAIAGTGPTSSTALVAQSPKRFRSNIPSKPGVKFATATTIKESAATARKSKVPLEMCITQEFDHDNSVKTVVQSNKDFSIAERPMLLSASGTTIPVPSYSSIDSHHQNTHYLLRPHGDGDSGYEASDSGSPPLRTSLDVHSARANKLSYKQILDGATAPPCDTWDERSGRVYERSMHEYMQSPPLGYMRPSPPRQNSPVVSQSKYTPHDYPTPREVYERSSGASGTMIPYYLFRRTDRIERNREAEKPIYVHVSEITMRR